MLDAVDDLEKSISKSERQSLLGKRSWKAAPSKSQFQNFDFKLSDWFATVGSCTGPSGPVIFTLACLAWRTGDLSTASTLFKIALVPCSVTIFSFSAEVALSYINKPVQEEQNVSVELGALHS